jgi:hypothetical protein
LKFSAELRRGGNGVTALQRIKPWLLARDEIQEVLEAMAAWIERRKPRCVSTFREP